MYGTVISFAKISDAIPEERVGFTQSGLHLIWLWIMLNFELIFGIEIVFMVLPWMQIECHMVNYNQMIYVMQKIPRRLEIGCNNNRSQNGKIDIAKK